MVRHTVQPYEYIFHEISMIFDKGQCTYVYVSLFSFTLRYITISTFITISFYFYISISILYFCILICFYFRHIPRTFVFPLIVDYRYFNRIMNWNNKHFRATIEIPLLVLKYSSCFICIGIPLPADCLCSVSDISVHVIF